jgi:precorrin-2 dehydrogenase/sirohydrochlorin ferrochelatase
MTGFPVTLELAGARVLVIGEVAAADADGQRKLTLLREAGATVDERDAFDPALLDGARVVIVFARDPSLAKKVHQAARARGVLCWCADDPAHSDFTMPAIARLGAARIAISTAGGSPALSARLRETFEAALDGEFARFVDELTALRERLKTSEPDPARRRAELARLLDGFEVDLKVRYPGWFRA